MSKQDIIDELVSVIATLRNFCASLKREDEEIREWARENGVALTRGMVRKARELVLATTGLKDGSAVNHYYYG